MTVFYGVEYTEESKKIASKYKEHFKAIESDFEKDFGKNHNKPKNLFLALTRLEECQLWLGKAIRDRQERPELFAEKKKKPVEKAPQKPQALTSDLRPGAKRVVIMRK